MSDTQWMYSKDHNLLHIIQQLASAGATAPEALAGHTHPKATNQVPSCTGTLNRQVSSITTTKTKLLGLMTKQRDPPPCPCPHSAPTFYRDLLHPVITDHPPGLDRVNPDLFIGRHV